MADLLNTFNFEGNNIRTLVLDGEPWFVAYDVAETLGYTNPLKAIRDHCKGVNETFVPSTGGLQVSKIIRENDVYRLVLRSKLSSAMKFESWVMDEVLPTIRKTGTFVAKDFDPTKLSRMDILLMAVESEKKVLELTCKVQELEPKAEALDYLCDAEGLHNVNSAAKLLGTGGRRLFGTLRNGKVLTKQNLPYQEYLDRGYFTVREYVMTNGGPAKGTLYAQTYVTGRGLAWLQKTFFSGDNAQR